MDSKTPEVLVLLVNDAGTHLIHLQQGNSPMVGFTTDIHAVRPEIAVMQGGFVAKAAALMSITNLTAIIPGLGAPSHIPLFKAAHGLRDGTSSKIVSEPMGPLSIHRSSKNHQTSICVGAVSR